MNSIIAIRDAVNRLMSEIHSGQLNPRAAAGLATLLSLQLRVLQGSEIEERLARVERQLAESKAEMERIEKDKK